MTPSKHATHYGPLYGFRYYKLTMPSPIKRIPSIEHMGCDDQFCGFEPWESSPVLMWKTFVWLHHITNGWRFGSITQVYSLQVPVPSQESGWSYTMYTMYNMCVTGNQFNSLWFVHFIEIFLRWYLFTFILFLEKKNHSTIMLEPKQFINHHMFCLFLQNGWGNNIQTWIKLHKDSYGSVTSFTTCCTSTFWQRISSRSFAEHIE
jgi:hypothetical protein